MENGCQCRNWEGLCGRTSKLMSSGIGTGTRIGATQNIGVNGICLCWIGTGLGRAWNGNGMELGQKVEEFGMGLNKKGWDGTGWDCDGSLDKNRTRVDLGWDREWNIYEQLQVNIHVHGCMFIYVH